MKNAFFLSFFLTRISCLIYYIQFFQIDMLILDTIMEGTMSQILYIGPRFYFMKCRKIKFEKMSKNYPFFVIK